MAPTLNMTFLFKPSSSIFPSERVLYFTGGGGGLGSPALLFLLSHLFCFTPFNTLVR